MKKVGFFCSFGFVKERRVLLVFVVVVLGSVSGVSEGWSGCGGRLLLCCVCSCCWLLNVSGIYEKGGIFLGLLALFFFGFSGFTFEVVGFVSLRA